MKKMILGLLLLVLCGYNSIAQTIDIELEITTLSKS